MSCCLFSAVLLCSTLTCFLPVSHLGSEDTDAVHPHRSDWQTFTETSSSCNFPVPPLSRLLLLVTSFCRLSVSVSSFSSSSVIPQSLSPPFLTSSPPVLSSEQPEKTSTAKADSDTWQLSRCTSTRPFVFQLLSSFYGSW